MKQLTLFALSLLFAFSFSSCDKDVNTVTATYQEATAIYGDLEAVRGEALNEPAKTVENPGKVYVGEHFILIGEEEKGVHVVNNSDINNPQFTNFINIPGNREFFVQGNYLYAESYYDLMKIDLTDINNVQLASRANNIFQETLTNENGEALLGFSFTEVTKKVDADTDLYAEISGNNYVYYDFARNIIPKSAVPSSFAGNSNQQSGTVNRVTYSQDHVYVVNNQSMAIIDDSNGDMEVVEPINEVYLPIGTETIFPYENKLFVGSRSSMDIYDAADPQNPQQIYTFAHATSCDPVLPKDDVAYITLRTADFSGCPGDINALVVLDIENLNSPQVAQEIAMNSPYGMTIIGDRLFVGEGENGLSVFDATDRLNPTLIFTDPSIIAYDIIAHPGDESMILIAGTDGLSQYSFEGDVLDINSEIDY